MFRYQILVEYIGTNFRGWQVQKKGKTIQGLIQKKISKLLKEKINLLGSGRTDAGVHAIEQSAHFDTNKEIKETKRLLQELSGNEVPDDCKKRLESAALEKDWERYDLIEMEARNRSTLCRVEDNLENLRKLFREEMSRLRRNLKGEP